MAPQESVPEEWQRQKAILDELFDGQLTIKTAAPKLAAATLPDPIPDINNEEDEFDIMADIERMFNYMLSALE